MRRESSFDKFNLRNNSKVLTGENDIQKSSFCGQPLISNSLRNSNSAFNFDLHTIIEKYGQHSDLLELILSCKVQEDKRKTEEAKLRQKEIEYLISNEVEQSNNNKINQKHKSVQEMSQNLGQNNGTFNFDENGWNIKQKQTGDTGYLIPSNSETNINSQYNPDLQNKRYLHYSKTHLSFQEQSSTEKLLNDNEKVMHVRKLYPEASSTLHKDINRNNELTSLSANSNNIQQNSGLNSPNNSFHISNNFKSSLQDVNTTLSHLSMDHHKPSSPPSQNTLPPLGYSFRQNCSSFLHDNTSHQSPVANSNTSNHEVTVSTGHEPQPNNIELNYISKSTTLQSSLFETSKKKNSTEYMNNMSYEDITKSPNEKTSSQTPDIRSPTRKLLLPINRLVRPQCNSTDKHPRRRHRLLQAITMVIETKEFPYNDNYSWKNNGNTVHRTTGQKSIYYKCSNSNKGCSVNKTVTFRENNKYLIKYRGYHLDECNNYHTAQTVHK